MTIGLARCADLLHPSINGLVEMRLESVLCGLVRVTECNGVQAFTVFRPETRFVIADNSDKVNIRMTNDRVRSTYWRPWKAMTGCMMEVRSNWKRMITDNMTAI